MDLSNGCIRSQVFIYSNFVCFMGSIFKSLFLKCSQQRTHQKYFFIMPNERRKNRNKVKIGGEERKGRKLRLKRATELAKFAGSQKFQNRWLNTWEAWVIPSEKAQEA